MFSILCDSVYHAGAELGSSHCEAINQVPPGGSINKLLAWPPV